MSNDNSSFSFRHKEGNRFNYWQISWEGLNDNFLVINNVITNEKRKSTNYDVNASLSQGLRFVRQPSFTLGFQFELDTLFIPGDTASFRLRQDKIYLDEDDLYFPLQDHALDGDGRNIKWVIFSGKRVSTSPQYIKD